MQSAHPEYPSHESLVYDSTDTDLETAPLLETPPQRPLAVPGSRVLPNVLDASGPSPPHVLLDPAPPNFKSREATTEKHAAHVDVSAWKETQRTARQGFAGGAVYKPRCGETSARRPSYAVFWFGAAMISSLLAVSLLVATGSLPACLGAGPVRESPTSTTVTTVFAPAETQHNWGAYTPWYPAGKYPDPPSNCEINQVRKPIIPCLSSNLIQT